MMGVGWLGLFDAIDHTAASEWSSRQGEAVTTEQIHHTASTSDSGARALMDPGGRTVSSNGLLLRDGTLVEVVPGQFRAFTSSSSFDRQSLTVETVNQTGSPSWEISETQRRRLARLNRDMAAAGLPIAVGRRGIGGILGHYEVPGTYATACPGPDMHLDRIAAMAAAGDPAPVIDYARLRRQKEETMYVKGATNPQVYNVYTDANGKPRLRTATQAEAVIATKAGLVTAFDDDRSIEVLAQQLGYVYQQPNPRPVVDIYSS